MIHREVQDTIPFVTRMKMSSRSVACVPKESTRTPPWTRAFRISPLAIGLAGVVDLEQAVVGGNLYVVHAGL